MRCKINYQIAVPKTAGIPLKKDVRKWIKNAAQYVHFNEDFEITIRIVSVQEIHYLNQTFRHKNKPTNVLSFSYAARNASSRRWFCHPLSEDSGQMTEDRELSDGAVAISDKYMHFKPQDDDEEIGDVVICAEIVEQEAKKQKIALPAHWAHMVIHGFLHLLGYNHQDKKSAEMMEKMEAEILKGV